MAALNVAPLQAQTPVGPNSRAEVVKIIEGLREIVSPNGLQAIETIPIGGIKQVVTIRSQDLRNPVIIYFHGGPGFVEMPLDWWWNRGWDEYFTVVHSKSPTATRGDQQVQRAQTQRFAAWWSSGEPLKANPTLQGGSSLDWGRE